jgi:hypothetical protein
MKIIILDSDDRLVFGAVVVVPFLVPLLDIEITVDEQ